jgi:predicted  nucleic acid-binding Zn-ribbon protein
MKQLYDLQQLDLRIASVEKSLAEVRRTLSDDSALSSARGRIEELEARLAELEPSRRQSERSNEQVQERLKAVENRLYGGAVTNPRELAAAEEERSFLQAQRGEQEDSLLELMVGIDEAQSARDQTREELARLEAVMEAARPALEAEETRLGAEIPELRQDREDVTPQFPSHVLAIYERLLKARNGYAVARVERGMCQGCRITLPSVELQRAKSSQDLVQCNSCQRILFVA